MATQGKDRQRERYEKEIEAARPRLMARARRKLQADETEDAVQDALLKGLEKAEWREIEKPANWIMGVLDNVILATVRQRRLRADVEVDAIVDPSDAYQGVIDRLAREQEVADQMAEIMRLAEAAGLNEREEYVIEARLRDESYGEIAAALSIGENAARAYHSQAVSKIKVARQQA